MYHFLEVPKTHRSICRPLGMCAGTVPVPKTGLNWASISASIKAQCNKYFLEVLETYRNISISLERCWHTCGQSGRTQNWPKLSKYIEEEEVNISASIRAPCTKYFLEVPETHRNISRSLGRCWHTFGQSASTQNWVDLSKCMWECGGQYPSFY